MSNRYAAVYAMAEKAEMTAGDIHKYDTRRYWRRKNKHLCVKCGGENNTGKILGPECRAKESDRGKLDRAFYTGLGLCNRCGKNRVFKNEKRCPECRAKAARNASRRGRTDKERENNNDSCRRRYHERVAQGICVKCGRRKAVRGKTQCGVCAQKQADRQRLRRNTSGIARAERYKYGLCYTCGSSLDMDGVKVCSRCYAALKRAREARGPIRALQWRQDNRMIYQSRPDYSCNTITKNAKKIFQTAPYADAFWN